MNVNKTNYIAFRMKPNKTKTEFQIVIDNEKVKQTISKIILGVINNENSVWELHIQSVKTIISSDIYALCITSGL